ncbi:MAG: hypothetical protein GY940_26725 [bacterium]|nr:hypothetical protein [bacterium]
MLMESILAGAATNLLTALTKKTTAGITELLSDDRLKSILEKSYQDFKECYAQQGGNKEEQQLLEVFKEFFSDSRTLKQFQWIFDAQSHRVDFNLLEETFVSICLERDIEVPDFHFFNAMADVVHAVETLARQEKDFSLSFQTADLKRLHQSLQKRGTVLNHTFARQKYLDQLTAHNNRLQFTGIPDLKEKKDITLPQVFVMQRARESVPVRDYHRMMTETRGPGEPGGDELQLMKRMGHFNTGSGEEKTPAVKFGEILTESKDGRFVVLGKPGSGKSSLLKFLMLEAARRFRGDHRDDRRRLPILIEIRRLEDALSKSKQPGYNILEYDPMGIKEDFYHQHYFLMKFIAEQGTWLDHREYVETRIHDFFKFSWNEGKDRNFYNKKSRKRFRGWVGTVTDPLTASDKLQTRG